MRILLISTPYFPHWDTDFPIDGGTKHHRSPKNSEELGQAKIVERGGDSITICVIIMRLLRTEISTATVQTIRSTHVCALAFPIQ
jgi:hypothetical protein